MRRLRHCRVPRDGALFGGKTHVAAESADYRVQRLEHRNVDDRYRAARAAGPDLLAEDPVLAGRHGRVVEPTGVNRDRVPPNKRACRRPRRRCVRPIDLKPKARRGANARLGAELRSPIITKTALGLRCVRWHGHAQDENRQRVNDQLLRSSECHENSSLCDPRTEAAASILARLDKWKNIAAGRPANRKTSRSTQQNFWSE